jgi:hypothetical protein
VDVIDLTTARGGLTATGGLTAGPGLAASTRAAMTAGSSPQQSPGNLRLLEDLASATGGRLVTAGQLQRHGLDAFAETTALYSLAFPRSRELTSGPHEIRIELPRHDSDHRLVYRRYFEIRNPAQQLADSTLSSLLLQWSANPLDAEVGIGDGGVGPGATSRTAALQMTLPFRSIGLRPSGEHHLGQLTSVSACGRPFRDAQPLGRQTLPVRVANADILTTLGRAVEHSWEVQVPFEATHCAIGIRDDLSRLTSTLVVALEEEP